MMASLFILISDKMIILFMLLAVVIGFEPDLYTVSEGDGEVILTVSLLSGSLGTEVEILLSTHGESAECESNRLTKLNFSKLILLFIQLLLIFMV